MPAVCAKLGVPYEAGHIHRSCGAVRLCWKGIILPRCGRHWNATHQPCQAAKPLSSLLTLLTHLPVPVKQGWHNLSACKTSWYLRCSESLRMTICLKKKKKKKKRKPNIWFIRTHFLYATRAEPGRTNSITCFNPRVTDCSVIYSACSFNTDYANSLSK